MTDEEKYRIYSDERHKAISWEYTEVDKVESRQFNTCILTIAASVAVIFIYGDAYFLGVGSVVSGAISLVALHVSAVLSQDAIRHYRDEIISPSMQPDPDKMKVYETKNRHVTTANYTSAIFMVVSLVHLVARCIAGSR